jgi:hypothetical protein
LATVFLAAVFFAAGFFATVFFAAGFFAADFFVALFAEVFAADFLAVFFAPDLRPEELEAPELPVLEPIGFDLSSDGISASFKSLRVTTVTLDQGNVVITSEFRLTDSRPSREGTIAVDIFLNDMRRACIGRPPNG